MNGYENSFICILHIGWKLLKKYLIVFFVAAALYVATCAPGALWQDSGMLQYRLWHNDIEGKLGLALAHPLFYILATCAKYVPVGQFGYRVNLFTAVVSAVAVANVFLLLRLWTKRDIPAVVAAISLGLSHTFWRHAVICETYNLFIALFIGELIVLLQYCRTEKVRYLYGLALLNGLAMADHMLASFGLICYVVFVVLLLIEKKVLLKHITVMVLLWIVAAAPYEYLIIKDIAQRGDIWATLASAAFGLDYQGNVLNTHITVRIVKENLLFVLMNFPTPNMLLAVVGLYALPRVSPCRKYAYILFALLIMFFVFAFRYTIVDRYAFFIPFYSMIAILAGLGVWVLIEKKKSIVFVCAVLVCSLLPIPAYAVSPGVARKVYPALGQRRQIPYRDNYEYFLQPWRCGYHGAERFAGEALAAVGEGAIIYADNTTVYPLLYCQEVLGQGAGVHVVSRLACSENASMLDQQSVSSLIAKGMVYVVTPDAGYCPAFLLGNYDFEPVGVVYRVVERDREE